MGCVSEANLERLLDQAVRKLSGPVEATNTALVFTNQLRIVRPLPPFGNPEQPVGGKALPYGASLVIALRREHHVKEGGEKVGVRIKAEVVKNKVAAPWRSAEFEIRS